MTSSVGVLRVVALAAGALLTEVALAQDQIRIGVLLLLGTLVHGWQAGNHVTMWTERYWLSSAKHLPYWNERK